MASLDKPQTSDISRVSSDSTCCNFDQHPCISLPLSFKIYCDKARVSYSIFYIGRKKSQHLNAISVGYTRLVYAMVALHDGPSVDSPVLGNSVLHNNTIDISLPNTDIQMTTKLSVSTFTLPIGTSSTPERFEWRRSRGQEAKNLGGHGRAWELVRLDNPELGTEEVVAVYKVDLCSPKLSGRFEFLGSGAMKELGKDWAIMAVVSALSLGQRHRDAMTATMGLSAAVA